jgi:hypothetical protein
MLFIIYNVLRGALSYENNLAFYNSRDFLLPVDTILNKDAGAWLFIKEHSKFNARRLSSSSRYMASGKMRHRVEKSAVGVLFLCTSVHMCLEVHFGVIPAINEIASIAAAACAGYKTKFISENTLRSITRWLWGFLSRASRLKTHSLAHLTDLSPAEIN